MAEPEHTEPAPRRGLRKTAARAGAVAWAALKAIRAARFVLRRCIEAVLALIILFEEWGWRPLAALLARLGRLAPIARLEAAIASLPPYPALLVFALPGLALLPLKLLALSLIATGHVVSAGLLFVGAKVVGTALVARIFQLTQPKLMQLAWFARLYNIFMPWKEALIARVRQSPVWQAGKAIKERAKTAAKAAWARWQPALEPIVARLRSLLRRG